MHNGLGKLVEAMNTIEARSGNTRREGKAGDADLYSHILESGARLAGSDGEVHPLPAELSDFLSELLADLKRGHALTICQDETQLSTFEVAKMLSVSRQYLVRILESGQIPFHMVGTHRRIYARDALAYKAKRDAERRNMLDDLLRAEIEEGLIDLVPLRGPDAG
jgi:excisionase family DNA binding protein